MRSNAYYIGHRPKNHVTYDENSSVDQVYFDSSNKSKKTIESAVSQLSCEDSNSSKCMEVEKESKNITKNTLSTFSIVQGMLKVLVSSGSTLTKPLMSASASIAGKVPLLRTSSFAVESKDNCDKENIPPKDMPHNIGKLQRSQKKSFIADEKRQLIGGGQSFVLRTATSSNNKRKRDAAVLKSNNKKFKHNPKKFKHNPKNAHNTPQSPALSTITMTEQGCSKNESGSFFRSSARGEKDGGNTFVTQSQMQWFLQLAENSVVSNFLEADVCYRYADNYLLAMVFAYFVRSKFTVKQFTKEYFFAALYLAHDMEEDEEDLKFEVFPWALGSNWRRSYSAILQKRDEIFWKIDCRAVVSKRCCDQVMAMAPDHWLWNRVRPSYHGGARRDYLKHPDENGFPRGPLKSPLQCKKCLERSCFESSNSYLLYVSESESAIDEQSLNDGETKEHKDSGYETLLCGPSDDLNDAILLADAPGSDAKYSSAEIPLTNDGCTRSPKTHCKKNIIEVECSSNSSIVVIDDDVEMSETESLKDTQKEKISFSQADTLVLGQLQSQEL